MRYLLPALELPPMYTLLPLALLILYVTIVRRSAAAGGAEARSRIERLPLRDDEDDDSK